MNKVLRGIFRHKRDKVTGGGRKLHKNKLHNLYSSSDMAYDRVQRWAFVNMVLKFRFHENGVFLDQLNSYLNFTVPHRWVVFL